MTIEICSSYRWYTCIFFFFFFVLSVL